MSHKCKVVIPPVVEPISLDEAKSHLRVPVDDDDMLIESCIRAAREHVEGIYNRALIEQTIELTVYRYASVIRLPKPPLMAVDSITYTDIDGHVTPYTDYEVDNREPAAVHLISPIDVLLSRTDPITITYTAGYGDPQDVPEPVKSALKMIVADLYDYREQKVEQYVINDTVDNLLASYRMWPV